MTGVYSTLLESVANKCLVPSNASRGINSVKGALIFLKPGLLVRKHELISMFEYHKHESKEKSDNVF